MKTNTRLSILSILGLCLLGAGPAALSTGAAAQETQPDYEALRQAIRRTASGGTNAAESSPVTTNPPQRQAVSPAAAPTPGSSPPATAPHAPRRTPARA